MATTITKGTATLAPLLVLGYAASRESQNVIHTLIGDGPPNVTLKAAGLRTGTLELLFADEATAKAAEDLHATEGVFRLVSTDRPSIGMYYVAQRTVRQLDPDTRVMWTLSVDFHEVSQF